MTPQPASPASGQGRWLLAFCLARTFFSFIFTTYSAALPLLRHDWAMSAAQSGMVQSAWHLGYMASLFAMGFWCDRYGAKRTYLLSAVAASVSAAAFGLLARDYQSALVLHGLAGLCSGGSYTPGLTLIAERIPASARGRAMGLYLAAGALGYGLSMLLSSALFPAGGWKLAFAVTGSLPALGLAMSLVVLRATPNVVHSASTKQSALRSMREVLANRPAMLSMLAYMFHCWELLGMWAWLPAYLAAAAQHLAAGQGQSAQAVGLGVMLSGLTYFSSMCGSLFGGSLSDRLGRTRTIVLFACMSLAFSFSFGLLLGWPLAVLFLAAALYNLSAIADSSIYSTALTELVEPRLIGAAYGMRSLMGFGAGVVSPWAFGLAFDAAGSLFPQSARLGWVAGFCILGLGALPVPLFTAWLRRRPESAKMCGGLR